MLEHGIVGNCATCALVSRKGAVEWMCWPDFSSPSVFAKILDSEKGGHLSITPRHRCRTEQRYISDTNILETTFSCRKYEFTVTDFFPRYRPIIPRVKGRKIGKNVLIRIIEPKRGRPEIRVEFSPKMDYARGSTEVAWEKNGATARKGRAEIRMAASFPAGRMMNGEYFTLTRPEFIALGERKDAEKCTMGTCRKMLARTKKYWKAWVGSLITPKMNRPAIVRSALLLKLLTFSETGAIVAAPTTSIPEEPGTGRCFDYRYCWVRDASYAVDAMKKIGRDIEAKEFMNFMIGIIRSQRRHRGDRLQIVYGIRGEKDLKEKVLPHLAGFGGSKPVRIGNAAYRQGQNDIYGALIDVIYLYFVYYEYEKRMLETHWEMLEFLVREIERHWKRVDSGIWEFRRKKAHFTFSKLMCYIGVDRAIRIAEHFRRPDLAKKWGALGNMIMKDMLDKGYNAKAQAFTMSYGSDDLDASLLRMTYHQFLPTTDRRIINTVNAVYKSMGKDGLVQRYTIRDDFGKSGSAFTICTFWLIDSLYYLGERETARKLYASIMKRANHLGLFSEDIEMGTGKQAGNFPQAYTHIAVINTSILLSEWNAKRKKINVGRFPRREW